ncbi:TerC family protein [Brevibacillus marinus]|uniref:TerC family protein n=1 Tax=Brevibacillus marinus TaxID=2496837 RepID=UPI000F832E33|nr:TerC family protein [Brevibacillus marinus]
MDWLTFLSSLVSIIIVDLVLAGDNALVIGMAARGLPEKLQKKAIIFGTAAAILIRAVLTFVVFWLLKIPLLLLAGGLILVWIAYNLLTEEEGEKQELYNSRSLREAIRTIVIADVVMGLDNVLAIAGVSHGSVVLVVLGLLISVPIMVWSSALIVRLLRRFPQIIYLGAGVLAWTAARMILDEPVLRPYLSPYPWFPWLFQAAVIAGVLLIGWWKRTRPALGEQG